MNIIGISYATTYGAGVTFEVETEHLITGTKYIITWGFTAYSWHKFKGTRPASTGYKEYESYQEIKQKFKSKKKGHEYMTYLDRILYELNAVKNVDPLLSLLNEEDIELYQDELERLIRKLLKNRSTISIDEKNKIISNRKSYIERIYNSVDGWNLFKKL